jgi:uncharacterized membrane protein YfcA
LAGARSSGVAFGLVAASLWLYILTPQQSASLIVGFGLLAQGYSVWKLRRALNWRLPFVAGAAFGVPAGVALLTWSDPRSIRIAVGVFLVLYSVYAFFRPALKPVTVGGIGADAAVGFPNGLLAGLTARRNSRDDLAPLRELRPVPSCRSLPDRDFRNSSVVGALTDD